MLNLLDGHREDAVRERLVNWKYLARMFRGLRSGHW